MKTSATFFLTLILIPLLARPLLADDQRKEADQAEKIVRKVLVQVNKGEPDWKEYFAAVVALAKAGPAVVPVLEKASKEVSGSARLFADYALWTLRKPAEGTKALAEFDPKKIDSARLGQPAPDFSLSDSTGKTYRLSQFRDKKAVVLIFLITED